MGSGGEGLKNLPNVATVKILKKLSQHETISILYDLPEIVCKTALVGR